MAEAKGSKFVDEVAGVARQGREDFLNALMRPSPDSLALTPPPVAADTPADPSAAQGLEGGFQSVLADYAGRGQGKEQQPERGKEASGLER
jgi:hypothetical protein